MSAGLAASTVTPGSTAPDESFTTPAMLDVLAPCANANAGIKLKTRATHTRRPKRAKTTRSLLGDEARSTGNRRRVPGTHCPQARPRELWESRGLRSKAGIVINCLHLLLQ